MERKEKIRGGQAANDSDLPDSPVRHRKPWQKALAHIRLLGPDEPKFRKDTKLVWDYIKSLEQQIDDYSKPKKNEPLELEIGAHSDLGIDITNEDCFSAIPRGFKFVVTDKDPMPLDATKKGSLATIPSAYSPPGVVEVWEFDLCFPSAGNAQQFPDNEFGGVLWRWEHVRNNSVNPVGLGCQLAIDGRNIAGAKGLHFKVPAPIGEGKTVNDFQYLSYLMPNAPTINFDHNYHIKIELMHSGDQGGYFKGSIDGQVIADYSGPNLPTDPDGQDPYLVFGYESQREKINTVEFTNIVRTK
jgi:hypothetical protein